MPHIAVKMFPGRTETQKQEFSEKVVELAMTVFGSSASSLSVSITEVEPSQWDAKVYDPEIVAAGSDLYKRPGYGALAGS
ncbi:tautomerase family protein [Rhizobium sp. RU36D]|uniref:tautomerase family protein n=1 Tax=Rhizobium sp. RU36D TaxID=1907415 RepID=UPI0009D81804|nr:tautomerase family protein [Rhizobium sp. RU36D]SMC96473.1 4-oxalocrotonate tautomerase [Rhizobium sp. RU36D]